jgi:hypothetical protein
VVEIFDALLRATDQDSATTIAGREFAFDQCDRKPSVRGSGIDHALRKEPRALVVTDRPDVADETSNRLASAPPEYASQEGNARIAADHVIDGHAGHGLRDLVHERGALGLARRLPRGPQSVQWCGALAEPSLDRRGMRAQLATANALG